MNAVCLILDLQLSKTLAMMMMMMIWLFFISRILTFWLIMYTASMTVSYTPDERSGGIIFLQNIVVCVQPFLGNPQEDVAPWGPDKVNPGSIRTSGEWSSQAHPGGLRSASKLWRYVSRKISKGTSPASLSLFSCLHILTRSSPSWATRQWLNVSDKELLAALRI